MTVLWPDVPRLEFVSIYCWPPEFICRGLNSVAQPRYQSKGRKAHASQWYRLAGRLHQGHASRIEALRHSDHRGGGRRWDDSQVSIAARGLRNKRGRSFAATNSAHAHGDRLLILSLSSRMHQGARAAVEAAVNAVPRQTSESGNRRWPPQ
jgi:hypothetical protein